VTTWSKRIFASHEGAKKAAVAERFGNHQLTAFATRDIVADRDEMMMVETRNSGDGSSVVYMALPDGERRYDHFVSIAFAEVPRDVSFWIGDDSGYRQLFKEQV
jgi:hypothetical protein